MTAVEIEGRLGAFSGMLIAIVALMVLTPALSWLIPVDFPFFLILLTSVLLVAAYTLRRSRIVLLAGLLLAVPAAVAGIVFEFAPGQLALVLHLGFDAAFLIVTGLLILSAVLERDQVDMDTLLGGISIYLVIGLAFTLLYMLLELSLPGSLVNLPSESEALSARDPERLFPPLIYFSFVTLTTVGYGGIRPVTQVAQLLAVSEAVIGQIYLVVFIARLVGLHIHQSRHD